MSVTKEQIEEAYGPSFEDYANGRAKLQPYSMLPPEKYQRDILRELCREQHEALRTYKELLRCYRVGETRTADLIERLHTADAVFDLFEEVK